MTPTVRPFGITSCRFTRRERLTEELLAAGAAAAASSSCSSSSSSSSGFSGPGSGSGGGARPKLKLVLEPRRRPATSAGPRTVRATPASSTHHRSAISRPPSPTTDRRGSSDTTPAGTPRCYAALLTSKVTAILSRWLVGRAQTRRAGPHRVSPLLGWWWRCVMSVLTELRGLRRQHCGLRGRDWRRRTPKHICRCHFTGLFPGPRPIKADIWQTQCNFDPSGWRSVKRQYVLVSATLGFR